MGERGGVREGEGWGPNDLGMWCDECAGNRGKDRAAGIIH